MLISKQIVQTLKSNMHKTAKKPFFRNVFFRNVFFRKKFCTYQLHAFKTN
jgi:hypothetical protein